MEEYLGTQIDIENINNIIKLLDDFNNTTLSFNKEKIKEIVKSLESESSITIDMLILTLVKMIEVEDIESIMGSVKNIYLVKCKQRGLINGTESSNS